MRDNAARLVDGELLHHRHMHREMQKGIGLTVFRVEVPVREPAWIVEQGMVFGVFQGGVDDKLLRARERA